MTVVFPNILNPAANFYTPVIVSVGLRLSVQGKLGFTHVKYMSYNSDDNTAWRHSSKKHYSERISMDDDDKPVNSVCVCEE